jgi:uncharacterized repeat protein (TIGR01451 family)
VTLTATTPLTNSLLAADEPTLVVARPGILADLEVQKHALTPLAQAGGLVTFTMVVTNHGPSPATNVQLYDVLPGGLTLVSATPSQGFCDTGVNCALGDAGLPGQRQRRADPQGHGDRDHRGAGARRRCKARWC